MYKKSSPTLRTALFILIAAVVAQLTLFPLAAISSGQEQVNQTTEVVIPDGTEFTVVTTDEISSKTATEGDPITFKVDEDVKINGHLVIAKDTVVKGTVTSAKKSGFLAAAATWASGSSP